MIARSPNRCFRGVPLVVVALLGLTGLLTAPATGQGCGGFKVLVFSKTAGFRHGPQITAGQAMIQRLGSANGFSVDLTEDAGKFTTTNLGQYAVVVFLNTTGDVLDPAQQTAFENYIQRGGGFVGIHSAADTEYGWPFYGRLMGAWFLNHPAVQQADLTVVDGNHPATAHLANRFSHTDEWYNYRTNPANDPTITVLLNLDESTYNGGNMGPVHPIAWSRDVPGSGRSFYTGLGHTTNSYGMAFYEKHVLGGILFASRSTRTPTIVGVRTYGTPSGTPAVALTARLASPTLGEFELSGATPGGSGVLGVSTCSASVALPPLTLLIDVSGRHFVGLVPVGFDASGRFKLAIPLRFALPAYVGTSLFLQGAQLAPTAGLSNGIEVTLQP